jgi:hypothetical protein
MTTASQVTNKGNPIAGTPFDFGAGHVNPAAALDPGLVYDAGEADYQQYTCSAAPSKSARPSYCRAACRGNKCNGAKGVRNVNLPSFSLTGFKPRRALTATRTVTFVGSGGATFTPKLELPAGFTGKVKVKRAGTNGRQTSTKDIVVSAAGDKRMYTLSITSQKGVATGWAFGALTWTSGKWSVRSPIALLIQ